MSLASDDSIDEIREAATGRKVVEILARTRAAVGPTDAFGAIEALRRAFAMPIPLANELVCWHGLGGRLTDQQVEQIGAEFFGRWLDARAAEGLGGARES